MAQELSEELEEQHAEEASTLRKDLVRAGIMISEREMAIKALEARLNDRETTVNRFRTLVAELTDERDHLRERVSEGTTALGQARDKAQVCRQAATFALEGRDDRFRYVSTSLYRTSWIKCNPFELRLK